MSKPAAQPAAKIVDIMFDVRHADSSPLYQPDIELETDPFNEDITSYHIAEQEFDERELELRITQGQPEMTIKKPDYDGDFSLFITLEGEGRDKQIVFNFMPQENMAEPWAALYIPVLQLAGVMTQARLDYNEKCRNALSDFKPENGQPLTENFLTSVISEPEVRESAIVAGAEAGGAYLAEQFEDFAVAPEGFFQNMAQWVNNAFAGSMMVASLTYQEDIGALVIREDNVTEPGPSVPDLKYRN